jgi:hypothetical protein
MYHEAPFRSPPNDLAQRLNWWKSLAKDSGAQTLAVSDKSSTLNLKHLKTDRMSQIVAIKLFSVSPSEMCDERTASKLSAFNTAKRNGLTGPNIIRMAQLQQYWNHGFNNPNYNHKARLTIPKSQTHPTTIILPPPTLQDLLNPVDGPGDSDHLSSPTTTTAEEMYGAMFDEGDDDESSPITFVRGVNLERLAIEAFVDLANPKLTVRFQDSPATSAPGTAKGKTNDSQPPKAKSSKWSEKDAQWASNGDLDW